MGLEQQLPQWKPLSKNLYALRLLTRQHQRLQEVKTQSTNQQHALGHSAFENEFIAKQLTKLITVYDQQLAALSEAIAQLIEQDPILKPRIEGLVKIKGLALLSVAVLIAETNGFERGAPWRLHQSAAPGELCRLRRGREPVGQPLGQNPHLQERQ